jgi:hypothetical protein
VDRSQIFEFTAPLGRHSGAGAWYFVSLPSEISDDIAEATARIRSGFGSVRITITVGATSWRTSIFPDSKTGTCVLPVKEVVWFAEKLEAGDDVRAQIQIVDL